MKTLTYGQALVEGLRELIEADERTHIMGQYFLGLTPQRALVGELAAEHPERFYYP
ncbi:MAG: hypothetical protein GY783_02480, partial [Gammaproteobacteria bacterium]|nr:hypothetical protein [Gammaproteobacteria bacterium]